MKKDFYDQSNHWLNQFDAAIKQISSDYDHVILVHGTFVGTDVFGLEPLLSGLEKSLGSRFLANIQKTVNIASNALAGETGKFTKDYINFIKENATFELHELNWGSENHHAGRYRGLVALLRMLIDKELSGKILCIGHSHAGQIFALLSRVLFEHKSPLINFILQNNYSENLQKKDLKQLTKCKFDFVTLGSPIRYLWAKGHYNLLHVINHRGDKLAGIGINGFQKSLHGDYVQVWGGSGSDFIATARIDRQLVKELEPMLEYEQNFDDQTEGLWRTERKTWFQSINNLPRVPPSGLTLLIDFEEKQLDKFAFVKTFFGHGVYMKRKKYASSF